MTHNYPSMKPYQELITAKLAGEKFSISKHQDYLCEAVAKALVDHGALPVSEASRILGVFMNTSFMAMRYKFADVIRQNGQPYELKIIPVGEAMYKVHGITAVDFPNSMVSAALVKKKNIVYSSEEGLERLVKATSSVKDGKIRLDPDNF